MSFSSLKGYKSLKLGDNEYETFNSKYINEMILIDRIAFVLMEKKENG